MREFWSTVLSVLGVLLFAVNHVDSKLEIQLGLLETSSGEYFCVAYYPSLTKIPAKSEAAPLKISDLLNLTQADTCHPNDADFPIDGKIPIVSEDNDYPNCSLAQRASELENLGASAVISDESIRDTFDPSDFNISIPVVKVLTEDLIKLNQTNPSDVFWIYHLDLGFFFDPAILVLFLMATLTVMLGSYLSGYFLISRSKQSQARNGDSVRDSASDISQNLHPSRIASQEDESSFAITPLKVLMYVVSMSCFLVFLYFFSGYIIYGLIGLYVILATISVYSIFESFVMWTYTKYPSLPTCFPPKLKCMELRQIILLLLCISLVAVWFVFRKASWVWILQDFIGIIICLLIIRDVRLPSLKICTLLLSLLFFYDIFFVFITPLFTKDGESIMVDVATGGDSGETFPIVLIVPRMLSLKKFCFSNFMMLGLGDIVIPGLLVSHCMSFDIYLENKWKVYWICANLGYIIGLVITDVALFLSGAAQPALLYLVPCTLLPTFLTALIRGEFKAMWTGDRTPHERL